jgi:pyruvate formate lyase activating enzyme
LQQVRPYIDHYYVDVKDLSPAIYRSYCRLDNTRVVANLGYLAAQGLQPKITIRLPLIPDYNDDSDRQRSRQQLEQMSFSDFDEFHYQKT